MKKKQIVEVDSDELDLLKLRLIAKIKQCKEADKLIAFLLMVDMTENELVEVADAYAKCKLQEKGGSDD